MNYLSANLILDRSGSMEKHRDTTIAAVNDYVANLRADQTTQTTISLTTFDTESIDQVWKDRPIHDVQVLSRDTYVPRGGTPLYDAVGGVVASLKAGMRPSSTKVALIIVTDGEENSSKEYRAADIKALLEGVQKDLGWLVIFLGANVDAFKEGEKIGTQSGHTMNYSGASMHHAMHASARSTHSYAGGAPVADSFFTDSEREAAVKGAPASLSQPVHPSPMPPVAGTVPPMPGVGSALKK